MADDEDDKDTLPPSIYDEDEPEGGLFRWMSVLVVLLPIAGFFGLAWYAYHNGGDTVDEKEVELVKAEQTPVKETPAEPGGMQIPNQDKTVYGLISGGKGEKPVVERILPAPEEPVARSGDTETWMSDSAKNKTKGDVEAVKIATDGTAPATLAATPATSAPTGTTAANTAPAQQFNPAKVRATQTTPAQTPSTQVAALTPPPSTTSTPAATPATPKPAPTPSKASDDSDDEEEQKPAPAAKPDTAPPPAGVRIQLGAYKSQAEAESNWKKIAGDFSDDMQGKQHYIVRADLGTKGTYYRLQVAPFASSGDAEQFCLDFVSAGQGCIVARGK